MGSFKIEENLSQQAKQKNKKNKKLAETKLYLLQQLK